MTDDVQQHGLARGLTDYGDKGFALYLRRSFAKSMGYSAAMLARPVSASRTPAAASTTAIASFPELLDAVKRGVLAAGALPVEFPTVSLGRSS